MRKNPSPVTGKLVLGLLAPFLILVFSGAAFSQDYPTKAITAVVGMEPGGIVDVATRVPHR